MNSSPNIKGLKPIWILFIRERFSTKDSCNKPTINIIDIPNMSDNKVKKYFLSQPMAAKLLKTILDSKKPTK